MCEKLLFGKRYSEASVLKFPSEGAAVVCPVVGTYGADEPGVTVRPA
jgi:hypothetical protein